MKRAAVFLTVFLFVSFSFAGDFAGDIDPFVIAAEKINMAVPRPMPPAEIENRDVEAEIFEALDKIFGKGEKAGSETFYPSKSFAESAPLYSFDLNKIKDAYLETDLTFRTSKGSKVYVSATKSFNCPGGGANCGETDKYFIVLTRGEERFLVRGKKIANALFMSGSETVNIDGDEFKLKLKVKLSNTARSVLEITKRGAKVLRVTVEEMGKAIMDKVETVNLSRTYKMTCGYELVQGKNGARFTDNVILVFAPFPIKDSTVYTIKASDLNPQGVKYPGIDPEYGFRLAGNTFEIFKL